MKKDKSTIQLTPHMMIAVCTCGRKAGMEAVTHPAYTHMGACMCGREHKYNDRTGKHFTQAFASNKVLGRVQKTHEK